MSSPKLCEANTSSTVHPICRIQCNKYQQRQAPMWKTVTVKPAIKQRPTNTVASNLDCRVGKAYSNHEMWCDIVHKYREERKCHEIFKRIVCWAFVLLRVSEFGFLCSVQLLRAPAKCQAPFERLRVGRESLRLCKVACLRPGTWSFFDMFLVCPSNNSMPRRIESKHLSRKGISMESQQLGIGRVPSESWGSNLFFQPHHRN